MISKIFQYSCTASIAILIAGCAGPAPTKEELNKEQISTLNIYEDNTVALYMPNSGIFSWTKYKDRVLAFSVVGNAHNLKDIRKISIVKTSSSGPERLVIDFIDGKKKEFPYYKGYNKKYNYYAPQWLLCDTQKKCERFQYFAYSDSYAASDFAKSGGLMGVYSRYIGKNAYAGRTFAGNISAISAIEMMNDYRALPLDQNFNVLSDVEFKKLNDDIEMGFAALNDLQAKENEQRNRVNEERRKEEQKIQSDSISMRKSMKIGTQTNCGQVFEVRPPMVGVQTMHGMQFIAIEKLYVPNSGCKFVNGQYVGR